jgi:hypothetical protein
VTRDTSRRGFNGLVVTLVIFSKVFYRRSAISRRLKVRRKGPRGGIYQTERQVASTGKLVAWSAGVSVCVWVRVGIVCWFVRNPYLHASIEEKNCLKEQVRRGTSLTCYRGFIHPILGIGIHLYPCLPTYPRVVKNSPFRRMSIF